MKAVVAAFNQEKALVGAFSVFTNLRMELFEALVETSTHRTGGSLVTTNCFLSGSCPGLDPRSAVLPRDRAGAAGQLQVLLRGDGGERERGAGQDAHVQTGHQVHAGGRLLLHLRQVSICGTVLSLFVRFKTNHS